MLSQEVQIHLPHVKAMAERLLTDIRYRGLAVGDRYLTTDEVSRLLGIGKTAACKVMRHLAEKEILISRQRSGTFIGPGLTRHRYSKVQTVFVLLPGGDPRASHWLFQPFIAGMHSESPGVNVQFTFVPEKDPVAYVRELIDGPRSRRKASARPRVVCVGSHGVA